MNENVKAILTNQMSRRLRASDVVVGLLAENTERMLTQATRLLRSIRWFGGELAAARVVMAGVGPLAPHSQQTLELLGAEIVTVTRFHPNNPTANRLQLLAALLEAPEELLLILDCDTLVVRDPLPHLTLDAFQGKIEGGPTVTDDVFERLFAHFGLTKAPRAHVMPLTGERTIPYFNAGVLAIPRSLARTLEPVWRKYNQVLADQPELAAPCDRHMHQASLALALAETGIPIHELPIALNYQINATHRKPPAGFLDIEPVIIHYHHLATEDGFLLPCPYPRAQARIDAFHERLRAEGFAPSAEPAKAVDSPPVLITGVRRSGTSLVAQLINAFGLYAGGPEELPPPDIYNPTGYFEHAEAVAIDRGVLDELDDEVRPDLSRLAPDRRAGYVERIRALATSLVIPSVARDLGGREARDARPRPAQVPRDARDDIWRGPFLIKDPHISLLAPLWQEALRNPVWVIVWRHPLAVARSLQRRDQRPLLASIVEWEHRNRTLLRDTRGLPRVLVSYERLIAEPLVVARELFDQLVAHGVRGATFPSVERIRQIVKPEFNRNGAALDETLLDDPQRALLAALRTGDVDDPGEVSPRTMQLLLEFDAAERVRKRLAATSELLENVFASRSWRIGFQLTGLLRRLRGIKAASAVDRWKQMTRS